MDLVIDRRTKKESMVITTRYRDIPFEEAVKCHAVRNERGCRRQWEKWRGQPVSIIVPATINPADGALCDGPFFRKTDGKNTVCPHIAEIGD